MSDSIGSGDNVIGVRTVYDAVLRLEGKLDSSLGRLESEFDIHKAEVTAELQAVRTEQTYQKGRMDGSLGMVKWLGPAGIAAVIIGAAKAAGLIP